MEIISNYGQYNFTKIEATIYLEECPSDVKENEYWVDIATDTYTQEACYIDNQRIEHIRIQRNLETKEHNVSWKTTVFVAKSICETESLVLLSSYCAILSKKCAMNIAFQDYGFVGFRVDPLSIRRYYSVDGTAYTDSDCARVGMVHFAATNKLHENVFALPKQRESKEPFRDKLLNSYMVALRSKDIVARYILLYYLIELISESKEWNQYKDNAIIADKKQWRYIALNEYFLNEFGVQGYSSFGKIYSLSPDVFKQIVDVRNDLAHRADQSKIRNVLYNHFIPILQAALKH